MKAFIFHLEFVLLVIVWTAPRLSTPRVITDVQLVDLWQPNSGRVQVQIDNSTWLDVCDDMWDNEDGRVVCRQLGFPGLAQRLKGRRIAEQRSTTSVRNFNCTGSESSLSECEHESKDMMCGSDRGAGVTCSVITGVRLVDQSQQYSGRVQVQIEDSTWLDVCHNRWSNEDCRVICRQLGFPGLAERLGGIRIGNRSAESVWNFECQGSESSLSECGHVSSDMMCGPRHGAGVTCSGVITDVRLVEGQPHSGRVQVQIEDSAWLDVCENGWSNEDGRVACRQLGFHDLFEITTRLPINEPSSEAVRDIICDGAEASLSACEYRSVGNCGSNNDRGAGVICVPFPTTEAPTEVITAVLPLAERTTSGARYGTTARPTADDGVLNGAYIGLALGCFLFVACASVTVVCLLKRHKRSARNSQGSNHLVLGELGNSQAGQAALNVVDSSAAYDYCAVEGKGIPVDAGYVNAPTPSPVKTRQAEKAAPKSVDTSAEYAYCAVEEREYSEVDAGHSDAPTQSAEYDYCAVEGKGIPVDAGYANAPTPAMAKTRQAQKAAPKSVDTSAEYAYCAVEGKGILEGSVDAEAGYLLPNPAPIKTSVNI